METSSTAAAIYFVWERSLKKRLYDLSVPVEAREKVARRSTAKIIDWLISPDSRFGKDPLQGRDQFLLQSLQEALVQLKERFGPEMDQWRLGDVRLHYALTKHPLSQALKPEFADPLNAGPVPRPGSGSTVNMTSYSDNQSSGGTFRIVADLADWDRSLGSNSPGQSGNPEDEHYQDLLEPWSKGRYFPLYYSRTRIEEVARSRTILQPADQ
jgi:penicillin amidase